MLGGPEADTGVTGRKLMVDSYGGFIPHGGGAFSGKDASKMDRSGAYMARYIAKNIVAAKLAKRCLVSLSYAIGISEPVAITVDTYGMGSVSDEAFLDAVRQLCDEHPCFDPVLIPEPPKKVFALPDSAPGFDRAAAYLRSRGISINVLAFCHELNLFYEDLPYHNVVFVSRDSAGTPKFACKRGTWGNFKMDVEGSEKQYGCCIQPDGDSDTVAIYESIIDGMSHATLDEQDGLPWKDKYRLALGGIYAPDPSKVSSIRRSTKPPAALEQFLLDHPHIRRMEICTDNDFAGRYAAKHIEEHYRDRYEVEIKQPVLEGFDYNDMAVARMEQRGRQRAAER